MPSTPGPWKVLPWHGGHRGAPIVTGAPGRPYDNATICTMAYWRDDDDHAELRANAYLLSAAPDLLAALKNVRQQIAVEIDRGGGIFADTQLAQIDAAIQKAESGDA